MRKTATVTACTAFSLLAAVGAWAHCDSLGGPLIPEAKAALEKGDVTPALKWVKKADEAQVKAAFAKAVKVRAQGPDARSLADQYFLETLVRLHRAGEGAPFTGIKDEPADPVAAMLDKALADGSAEEMIAEFQAHLAAAVREKFRRAMEARKRKDASVKEGREFVEAYVVYTHYLEALHAAIAAAGGEPHGH
ncbi:MAG: hypothetical protein HYX59_14565 [Elusimicrobia bacterium]|nr:hypothetical protein [Elusimicrobiota bacterium]